MFFILSAVHNKQAANNSPQKEECESPLGLASPPNRMTTGSHQSRASISSKGHFS